MFLHEVVGFAIELKNFCTSPDTLTRTGYVNSNDGEENQLAYIFYRRFGWNIMDYRIVFFYYDNYSYWSSWDFSEDRFRTAVEDGLIELNKKEKPESNNQDLNKEQNSVQSQNLNLKKGNSNSEKQSSQISNYYFWKRRFDYINLLEDFLKNRKNLIQLEYEFLQLRSNHLKDVKLLTSNLELIQTLDLNPKSKNVSKIIENLFDLFEILYDSDSELDLDSDPTFVEVKSEIQVLYNRLKEL